MVLKDGIARQVLTLVAALVMSAGSAFADGDKKIEKGVKVDRETAKTIALAEVPGRVIDIDLEKKKGVVYWAVDVKPSDGKGVKKEVRIDANSGNILSIKDDTDDDDDDKDDKGKDVKEKKD